MRGFAYSRPEVETVALGLIAKPETAVVAGGTELLNWMRLGVASPHQLVDIGRLPGRREIVVNGDTLEIGALANLNHVGEHELVRKHAAVLSDACLLAASPQLRNRATLGGNVLQRTRCPYWRTEAPLPSPCNKREAGTGCSAIEGISDTQAIFGWTDACAATHPSDPLVALACLDAEVEIASVRGERCIPVGDLHVSQEEALEAGESPAEYETTLAADELILGYRIPIRVGARSRYLKVRQRQSYAYALVTAAAQVTLEDDRVISVALALGSVAQRPWRLTNAEAALVGEPATEAIVRAAIDADFAEARPLPGNAYKVRMARNAAVRVFMEAAS